VEQLPEQHSAPEEQAVPVGLQVAACAGVGATIEVTSGTAIAAATPNARTISRLVIAASIAGGTTLSSSR